MRSYLLTILLLSWASVSFSQQAEQKGAVTEVLNTFQQAIVNNDSAKAAGLLADSARILESGGIETKQEYLSHHFHADGKFLSAMNREIDLQKVSIEGDAAWVSTKTHLWGSYNDRKLNLNSLELAVLKKIDGEWKITALHWSSGQRNE